MAVVYFSSVKFEHGLYMAFWVGSLFFRPGSPLVHILVLEGIYVFVS